MAVIAEPISKPKPKSLARVLPILGWLPSYKAAWLSADVIAGLTLWGLVVPEAMAYAGIANLPPQAGLYTLLASLLLYAVFGTSRHLAAPGGPGHLGDLSLDRVLGCRGDRCHGSRQRI